MTNISIRRTGTRTWEADSRTRDERGKHRMTVGLDGEVFCTCEAAMNNLKCWAAKAVREEIEMSEVTTRELAPIKVSPPVSSLPTEKELSAMERSAKLIMAGAITLPEGVRTPQQAAAMVLYGWEMGLKPMTAMTQLYVVKGRVQPSAQVMLGVAQAREPDIRLHIEELTDTRCTMRLIRPSRHVNEAYTVDWNDIKKAGLESDMNKKYPKERMAYHASKRLMRLFCPDLIHNIEGVALPGVSVVDDEISDDDLYNDGDDAIDAAYVERPGNVDGDGVINEAPAPAAITDATKQALGASWVRLRDAYKAAERVDDLVRIRGEWAERYPAVMLEKSMHWAGANEAEGQELLRLFAEAMPACEHDKVYDDDKALFICGKCGIEMEEGFDEPNAAATAEAQQAGLPVT